MGIWQRENIYMSSFHLLLGIVANPNPIGSRCFFALVHIFEIGRIQALIRNRTILNSESGSEN